MNKLTVTSTGNFKFEKKKHFRIQSLSGSFGCDYKVTTATDEMRVLKDFRFFQGEKQLFFMNEAPGADVEISNQGYVVFFDHRYHFRKELILHFYSSQGEKLFSKKIMGASLFGFSPRGDQFAVGNGKRCQLIYLTDGKTSVFPPANQFAISDDGKIVVFAFQDKISIYVNDKLRWIKKHELGFVRKLAVSGDNGLIAAIGKSKFQVYASDSGKLLFEVESEKGKNYRDLKFDGTHIILGIQSRQKGISRGEMQIYDFQGRRLKTTAGQERKFRTFENEKKLKKMNEETGGTLPWIFFPFDSMRTVWNYYEQHMGWGNFSNSYLHQGLDIIVPVAEPVYAVESGIVKCVLTIGGSHYWRVAIAKEQSAGWSNGWLYAHLIFESINVAVGDTVNLHDYLGDIIEWTDDWGHIHFVEISDSGTVWEYFDNEWGINFNPLQVLRPVPDTSAPVIENVFEDTKFAFPYNGTDFYLAPDSLYGDVDIVVKITDKIGDSPWDQPAYETFYWIKKLPENQVVVPRTLGQRLNHKFDFYASGKYTPYALLIYKRDEQLLPSSWMSMRRNFYHILTNNNGDAYLDLAEENFALHTADFTDGSYRVFVEARDINGNFSVDSMDVVFSNGSSTVGEKAVNQVKSFQLGQNYPNPFNPTTLIPFSLPKTEDVLIVVFDVNGRQIQEMNLGKMSAGNHEVKFDGSGLSTGIYFYRLKAGKFSQTQKMVIVQ